MLYNRGMETTAKTITFGLRLPGIETKCVIVEAESLEDALRIANAPAGTTGNGLFPEVAEMMVARGIATRVVALT
jgi:hypothetical protein